MKKNIFLIIFILPQFLFNLYGQTKHDTKDFIIEKVTANSPLENYITYIFFQNIFKSDAEKLSGKTLTEEEFDNILIFARDIYTDKSYNKSIAETIDIRDITKVSTTRTVEKINYYTITVYIGEKYYSKKYKYSSISGIEHEYLNKMEILISDNKETAIKIKKAIIHLAKLYGVNAKDGDLF